MSPKDRLAWLAGKRRGEFAVKYHTSTKGKRLDFKKFHYLMKPYADTSNDITLMCGVQSGKTEWVVCDAFSLISFGASYQLVQPKDDIVAMFTRTRLNEPIGRAEHYKKHITTMNLNRLFKWQTETTEAGLLRVVFSNRADEMIAFPADIIGVDELDSCDLNNLSLLPDRLLGSEYGLERRTGTPTTVGNDLVHNLNWNYCQSDQQQYFIKCGSCGTNQILDWYTNFVEEKRDEETGKLLDFKLRDTDFTPDKIRDIFPVCKCCGNYFQRLDPGEWQPSVRMNQFIRKRGYNWGKLNSPLVTVRKIWTDYLQAVNNPVAMQRFSNSILGRPYLGSGTQITEGMLWNCTEDYYLSPETDTCEHHCSMGIDVGPKYLDVRISSYPKDCGDKRRAEYIGKVKSFEELHGLVARFNVRTAVIDAEPEVRESLKFKEKARCAVFICYTREKKGMVLSDLLMEKVKEEKKLTIDRTTMMDCVLAAYTAKQVILPKNLQFLSEGSYISEMVNPTRVLEVDDKGNEKFVWTSGSDHSFLADTYDYCAMLLGSFDSRNMAGFSMKRSDCMLVDPMDDLDLHSQMA